MTRPAGARRVDEVAGTWVRGGLWRSVGASAGHQRVAAVGCGVSARIGQHGADGPLQPLPHATPAHVRMAVAGRSAAVRSLLCGRPLYGVLLARGHCSPQLRLQTGAV